MRKQADIYTDFGGSIFTRGAANALGNSISAETGADLSGVGDTLSFGGDLIGRLSHPKSIDDIKEMDTAAGMGFVPGVGSYRMALRRNAIRNLLKSDPDSSVNNWSEFFGPAGNAILYTLGGAGLGSALSKGNGWGALVGGASGLALSTVGNGVGALAALIRKRRTLKEQKEYEDSSHWLKHLFVPGTATYDYYKGLGASKYISEKDKEELEKELAELNKTSSYRYPRAIREYLSR